MQTKLIEVDVYYCCDGWSRAKGSNECTKRMYIGYGLGSFCESTISRFPLFRFPFDTYNGEGGHLCLLRYCLGHMYGYARERYKRRRDGGSQKQ